MDWAYTRDAGNILVFFPRWFWLDRSIHMRRPAHGKSHALSVHICWEIWGPAYFSFRQCQRTINDKVVTWLQAQGCTKLESPIYNPRSNGLAKRAVHPVKKAMRAWNSSLRVSLNAFL